MSCATICSFDPRFDGTCRGVTRQLDSTGQLDFVAVPEKVVQLRVPVLAVKPPAILRRDESQLRRLDAQLAGYEPVAPKALRNIEFQGEPLNFSPFESDCCCEDGWVQVAPGPCQATDGNPRLLKTRVDLLFELVEMRKEEAPASLHKRETHRQYGRQ